MRPTAPNNLSRRGFFVTVSAAAVGGFALAQGAARAAMNRTDIASLPPFRAYYHDEGADWSGAAGTCF